MHVFPSALSLEGRNSEATDVFYPGRFHGRAIFGMMMLGEHQSMDDFRLPGFPTGASPKEGQEDVQYKDGYTWSRATAEGNPPGQIRVVQGYVCLGVALP